MMQILIVVLADSHFDFDTSVKVKINIIARECSPGPRNPSKKQMTWAEESRAEMVFGRIGQDRCGREARSKLDSSNRSTILLVILTTVASHSHVMKLHYFHWSKNRYRLLLARNQATRYIVPVENHPGKLLVF